MLSPLSLKIAVRVAVMLLLSTMTQAQDRKETAPPNRPRLIKAFVIDDRLSALRRAPDAQSEIIHRLRLARPVYLVDFNSAQHQGIKFYRVAVTRRTRGWLPESAIALPGRRGDDERIMKLIESAEDGFDRITLCKLLIENFARSTYLPRALLLMGEEAERAAIALSQRARRRLSDVDELKASASLKDYYLNDAGLDRFSRLGVVFDFNESSVDYVYDGRTYREVVKRFPKTEEAQTARQHLEAVEKKLARRK